MSGFQRVADTANQVMNVAAQARPMIDLLASQLAPRSPSAAPAAAEPLPSPSAAPVATKEPTAPEPNAAAASTAAPASPLAPAAPSGVPAIIPPSEPPPTLEPMAPPLPSVAAAAPTPAVAPATPPMAAPATPAPATPPMAAPYAVSPYAVGSLPPAGYDPRAFAPPPFGAYAYALPPVAAPGWATLPGASATLPTPAALVDLLQALQTGAIPQLPRSTLTRDDSGAAMAEPSARASRDATALLSLILSNGQVQDSLRRAALQSSPRDLQLRMPRAPGSSRQDVVPLPMNAVVQAIAALASRSTLELQENDSAEADAEQSPHEFLLSESGDLLVEPADYERRTDLVVHYFRCAAQAERGDSWK